MYNHLVNATKGRVIQELKDIFASHPIFKTLEIYNRFPYNERIQEGVIVKNSSANRVPLSADNFQGTVFSYVGYANHSNFPGKSLEWVREDTQHLANWVIKRDFSNQFQVSNEIIVLDSTPLSKNDDLLPADSIKQVSVYINNFKVIPKSVLGVENKIILNQAPPINSKVEVSFWERNLVPTGIYQLEITDGDPQIHKYSFKIDALLEKKEILIQKATNNETSCRLSKYPIFAKSLRLRENKEIIMTDGTDYLVDEATGIITFLNPPLTNSTIEATYRIQGLTTGPFEIPYFNYADNSSLPGVILAFGRGVAIGDKHFIFISNDREMTAQEYSGKWEMNISLDIYAKDSYKIEEIIDLVTSNLQVYRKSDLDAEGIYLVDVSFGGESEQIFDEATGDMQYMGTVDYNFMTEWIMHKPLLLTVEGYILSDGLTIAPEPYLLNKNMNFEKIK